MRRVATHRAYDLITSHWISFPVIELDENGCVCRIYSLTEEISHTEWLPGMILLSPCPINKGVEEEFSMFIKRVTCMARIYANTPKRAYWISFFNLSDVGFTSSSRIVAL